MFSKTNREAGGASGLPSIISADMSVEGNLDADGTVQIEGKITGDVRCHSITLGEQGEITGTLECQDAHIHGAVHGQILATVVALATTARITGDIQHEEISIEAGAHVDGRLVRRDPNQTQLNLVVGENT